MAKENLETKLNPFETPKSVLEELSNNDVQDVMLANYRANGKFYGQVLGMFGGVGLAWEYAYSESISGLLAQVGVLTIGCAYIVGKIGEKVAEQIYKYSQQNSE